MGIFKMPTEKERAEDFFRTCVECGSRTAEVLCDAEVGEPNSAHVFSKRMGVFNFTYTELCNIPLCLKCAVTIRGKDYCKFHSDAKNRVDMIHVPDNGKYRNIRNMINSFKHLGIFNLDRIEYEQN